MLFAKLCPTEWADSIYDYDFRKAYEKGFRGVILDIDNTLVPHDAPADERAAELCGKLKEIGIKPVIVSNNHEPRAKSFAEAVGVPFICDAGKPSVKGYGEALKILGLNKNEVLCVGDQLLTDIWGANNAGLSSLLVEPLDKTTDTAWIKVKRVLEKPIKLLHNAKRTSRIAQD